MANRTLTVSGWDDLIECVGQLEIHKNPQIWYLRGQSDAAWKLLPSFLRTFGLHSHDAANALAIEKVALQLFQSQAHLYLKPDLIDRNSWSCIAWWSLMQHYSCPTRLLDWTRSPYVAAYFAVDQHFDRDGAIWYFPAPALEREMVRQYGTFQYADAEEFLEKAGHNSVYPVIGFQHTQRSAAQQGVFTVGASILADHDKTITDALASCPHNDQLTKVIIPADLKHEFLSRLHTMNITAKTLFPGIDGVGRSVSEIVTLRVWRLGFGESCSILGRISTDHDECGKYNLEC